MRARVCADAPIYAAPVQGSTAPNPPMVRAPEGLGRDEIIARWKDRLSAHYTKGSMDRMISTVERVWEWAGWRTHLDIEYEDADVVLAARRRGDNDIKWGPTTHDQAVSTLHTFGEFLRKRKLRDCNPLADLEACGEEGGDGARPLTTKQAEVLILSSLNRHWKSRRARGCAPLFWYTMLRTGLRYTEASEILWGDVYEEPEGATFITRPDLPGNKSGRKAEIPIHSHLWHLLTQHRRAVPSGAKDRLFPKAPSHATWHLEREAAGIPEEDPRYGPCKPHSCRKTFGTWLDAQCLPSGMVTRLMRHKGTLAEDKYIKHGATDPGMARRAIESLPTIWPESIDVFSIRGSKKLANSRLMVDTRGTTQDQAPCVSSPKLCETSGPVQDLGSCVVTRPAGPGPFVAQSSESEPSTVVSTPSRGRVPNSCSNGQIPERIDAQMRVALSLASWLENDIGGSKQEPTHAADPSPPPLPLPPHLTPPPLPE